MRVEKFDCLIESIIAKVVVLNRNPLLMSESVGPYLKHHDKYSLVDKGREK